MWMIRARASRSRAISLIVTILVLTVPLLSPFNLLPVAEAGNRPNAHAVLEVRYSLTRYRITPEWKDGVIEIELYEKRAPLTTANFIMLAESGFYDGTLFHRVIDDFVIQGGDPNTKDNENQLDWWDDGSGGSEEKIDLESHEELTHVDGAVGMARELGDPDSATSQFYICDGPQHRLDDTDENNENRTYKYIDDRGYAVFGITVKGLDVVREIAKVWTTTDSEIDTPNPLPTIAVHVHDHPIYDVILVKVTIIHYEEEKDDSGLTTEQIAGLGAGIFVIGCAVIVLMLRQGRLKFIEERIPGKGRVK